MARQKTMGGRIALSVQADFGAEIDAWRGAQRPIPNRSEAIRALVKLGLEAWRAEDQGGNEASA